MNNSINTCMKSYLGWRIRNKNWPKTRRRSLGQQWNSLITKMTITKRRQDVQWLPKDDWFLTEDHQELKKEREKERCSGSYCQAVAFLVMKDDSFSERIHKPKIHWNTRNDWILNNKLLIRERTLIDLSFISFCW